MTMVQFQSSDCGSFREFPRLIFSKQNRVIRKTLKLNTAEQNREGTQWKEAEQSRKN